MWTKKEAARDSLELAGVEDTAKASADSTHLAEAAMSLLACKSEDEVYELAGAFMLLLAPDSVVVVNELSPDLESLTTRKVFGLGGEVLRKATKLVGFDPVGKSSVLHPEHRDDLLSGALARVPGGFAELASLEIPRALAEASTKMLGLRDVFSIGITDGAHAIGNIQIYTRAPDVVPPAQIIEYFVHHCFAAVTGIRKEQALIETNDQMSQLIDSMVEGLAVHEIILDEDGRPCDYRFIDVNPAFEAMTGLRAGDIIGRTVREVLPDTEPSWIERYGSVATTGISVEFEQYSRVLDRHYSVVAYRPAPGHFATAVSDITERKQAEDELERVRILLRSSLNSQKDTILFSIDSDYRYLFFNHAHAEAMKTAYGQNVELGQNILDLITSDDDRVAAKENYDRALAGESHSNVAVYGDIENAYYESFFNPMLDENGHIIGATGLARDITERKRAELELHRAHATLQAALDHSPVGIAIADAPDGRLTYVNDAGLRVRGGDRKSIVDGVGINEYVASWQLFDLDGRVLEPEDVPLARAVMFGEIARREFVIRRGEDDDRIVIANAAPIRDKDGEVEQAIVVFTDVTETRKAETELARGRVQLEGLLAEREDTLIRLNNSLASIVKIVSEVAETRDPYTAGHQRRVAELAVAMALRMGMSSEQVEEIRIAGLLHDIGKLSVPAEILTKPGKLSELEFELIKVHSQSGYDIIRSADLEGPTAEIVYQHHERCDGSGYPQGLTADEILPAAKVLIVADVVEAMYSHRPYRPGLGIGPALAEIERGSGTQYDARVSEACLACFREDGFQFSLQKS